MRQLLDNGHEVIAFVLKNSNLSTINNLPLKIIEGNILKIEENKKKKDEGYNATEGMINFKNSLRIKIIQLQK